MPNPVTVSVAVPRQSPRSREVPFVHERHAKVACVDCHAERVTLAPEPGPQACTSCHVEHHTAGLDCASCHRTSDIMKAHAPPIDAHRACDECHTERTVAALEPTRSFCLACHGTEADHYAGKECTVCHLQSSPEGYRDTLDQHG